MRAFACLGLVNLLPFFKQDRYKMEQGPLFFHDESP